MLEFHFRIRFQPYHRFRHFITYCTAALVNFIKIGTPSAESWRRSSEARHSSANQILSRYFSSRLKLTICGLEKQTSAILEFFFRFRFQPYYRSRHIILQQAAQFHPNRITLGGVMMSYRFSKWRLLRFKFWIGSRCLLHKVSVYQRTKAYALPVIHSMICEFRMFLLRFL